MGAAGTGLAFAPFVPWGTFLPNPSSASAEKVPVELPDGTQANINTFPINHAEVITYPKTGDRVLDEEAFRKWQFIRLPEKFGGDETEKGDRIFLKDSKEIYTGKEIGELAEECDAKFNTESVISIELSDVTPDELKEWGYPDAKLLPIPGK